MGVIDRDTCVCSNHRGSSTNYQYPSRSLHIPASVSESISSVPANTLHSNSEYETSNVSTLLDKLVLRLLRTCVHLPFSRKSYLFTWLKWQIFFTQHYLLSGLGWTTVAIFHFVFSEPSSAFAERIFLILDRSFT